MNNSDNLVESDVSVVRAYLQYLLSTSDYNAVINPCLFETELCKCLIHYVNEWFFDNKRQSEYHVYLMWFALRAIFTSGCVLVTPEVVEADFQTYPWEFQKCFDVPDDWRDERELKRQYYKITAIAKSLINKCLQHGYTIPKISMPFGVNNVIQVDWNMYGPA